MTQRLVKRYSKDPAGNEASWKTGHLLVNLGFWNFRFSDFRFSRFLFWEICLKNMLVRYRGINNKGVLERPWTIWRVVEAISTTLKCQFTGKCWKVDFLIPCTTKSAETLQVAPYSRCGHPGNPQTSPIPFKIVKKPVFVKNPKNPGSLTRASH